MGDAWTPRRQGDAGELSAINWFVSQGACVALPLFPHPDYDLIVDFGHRVERVQVKTSTCRVRDRFAVQLSTRGGNQSWNRTIKHLNASRCDSLFAHVGDGRRWYIPIAALDGGSGLTLGGPKYADFEVDPGDSLPAREQRQAARSS